MKLISLILNQLQKKLITILDKTISKTPVINTQNNLIQQIQDNFMRREGSTVFSVDKLCTNDPQRYHMDSACNALTVGVAQCIGGQVDGDIAEFGVGSGTTGLALAAAINGVQSVWSDSLTMAGYSNKRLFLFDSFVGLPNLSMPEDLTSIHVVSGAWAPGYCRGISAEQLKNRINEVLPKADFEIYEGWFKDQIKQLKPSNKFALIHIDCDLYESTIDVLSYLFDNNMISFGGQIYFDDWNCNASSEQAGEQAAWHKIVKDYNVKYSDEGPYAIFGHKFIVKNYKKIVNL